MPDALVLSAIAAAVDYGATGNVAWIGLVASALWPG